VHTHTFSSARTRPPRRAALPSARRAPLVRTKAIKRHLARARRTPDSHPAPPSMASRGPHALTGRGERQVSRPAAQGRAGAEDAADAADASTTAHVPTSQSCSQHGFNFLWLLWFFSVVVLPCAASSRRHGERGEAARAAPVRLHPAPTNGRDGGGALSGPTGSSPCPSPPRRSSCGRSRRARTTSTRRGPCASPPSPGGSSF